MSVVIYKDGLRELCAPQKLHYQLQAGWSLEDVPKNGPSVESEEVVLPDLERYRTLAKDLGIRIHPNSKLETIIKKVEEAANGNKD